jgi:pimeloyl-ACP methyl ester carboxylesterase
MDPDPARVTILLLHAFPLDARMWEAQREALAGREVVTPDLPRLGASMAEWASAALELVTGRFAAVGASMGGYCALEIARQAPERLRGLALVGARADADSPERREGRAATIELIRSAGAEALWEDMREKLFAPGADPAAVERARSLALEQSPDDLVRAVEVIRDRADSTDLVRSLDVPVLVAVGEHDPYFPPAEAQTLAADLRNGRLHVFRGCGHLPSLEQPDEFNRVLTEFLADAEADK